MKKYNLLITGGTGSFGKKYVEHAIKNKNFNKIVVYSRDEMKQWEMQNSISSERIKFIIGDIRDIDRIKHATKDIDYIVHAAATKIVPTAEYNPLECIKTNILGAANLIESSIENNVKKVIALSTDKASNPINLYGATKLASDKLFIAANNNKIISTKFAVVRYGNVLGSRGSIVPFFQQIKKQEYFPITDLKMTRFLIRLKDAVDIVNFSFKDMVGGEIYVKKLPSVKITDIAKAVNSKAKFKIIGIRPGEKLHEQMISEEESDNTFEYKSYYKILPSINNWHQDKKRIKNGKKVKINFSYNSINNTEWLDIDEIKKWITT
jgi:UDP-N-acetylglucosamine 4,6-dehydratase (inverting)